MKNPVWVVKAVEPREDYTLLITFENGEKKIFDAKELLDIPICEPLKNISFFMKAHAAYDTVAWSDDIDIAPEYLYEQGIPFEV